MKVAGHAYLQAQVLPGTAILSRQTDTSTVSALPDHTGTQAHAHERMRTEMP
jgi:hypothetical protein